MGNQKRNKQPKTELVFDNKKREEFLTGFTKRKQQRKKKAVEETERKLKEEKKRIKDEVRQSAGSCKLMKLPYSHNFRLKT
jgi:ribosomal RNA-processing protein 17